MLTQRTLTALVLVPIAVAVMLLPPTFVVALVIGAMCMQALWEWTRLAGLRAHAPRAAILLANVALFGLAWAFRDTPAAWFVIGAGLAWWLLALLWLGNFSYGAAPTRENLWIKIAAAELSILPAWLALMKLHAGADHGPLWAMLALVLIWAADTGAYFAGKRFGRAKLAPRISPNKTIAGAVGALIAAGLIALGWGWLLEVRGVALLALVAIALLAVIASIVGDLFESLLKRQADVKDSGTLFPGHGGLLDRLDSLFAALPVFAAGTALLDLAWPR